MKTLILKRSNRRGAALPIVAACIVGICGFVALAVDVGRMAVAKAEVQSIADVAATAATRSLNGVLPQNLALATQNANNAASNFSILGVPVSIGAGGNTTITLTYGTYHYDPVAQQFSPQFTLQPGENFNLVQANVTTTAPTTFAKVFGVSAFNMTAGSIAAYRPRDVAIVLDYSGSMNNESDIWNNEAYLDNGQAAPNNPNFTSNNAETVFPQFGHYSNQTNYSDYAHYANLLCPSANSSASNNPLLNNAAIGKCNVSQAALGIPAMVGDFWSNNRGQTANGAFTSAPDTYATAPGGDNYLRVNNVSGNPYASTLQAINNGSLGPNAGFETNGYKQFTGTTFNGYTQGPRYWGKTFFIWPPDPTNDWRKKYFGTNDNTKLWDANGNWLDPPGNYTINYKAILAWINSAPNIFPAELRSGNTLFYSAIPTDVSASAYDHTQPNYNITNADQRFWKEYIDYVIGVWRDPNGNIQHPAHPACSIGNDYTFGTVKISAPPGSPYMNYADNPQRPRHRLWFGPMTMIQFMSDTGLFPATTHDIAMYPMKVGLGLALMDIQGNHPNDLVSMCLFSRPQYNNDAQGTGAFNVAQFSLGNNYQAMINALWVPPGGGTTDVRPWDPINAQTARAHGDYDANTASSYGFMLAYNQLSSSAVLRGVEQSTGPGTGGLGRVGAQRLVIYETDGMANQDSLPGNSLFNGGGGNSYYQIMPGQTLNGGGYNQTNLLQVVQNICNNADGTPGNPPGFTPFTPNQGYPGYAAPGKPVSIECVAFGAIFEVPGPTQNSSVALLQQISTIGGTVFPSSPTDPTNGWRWCIGTMAQRQSSLRTAFMNIMNSGVPITLIK
jgi:Flp pilus assembly protein TadG